jgi:Na+/proline symporter
MLGGFFLGLFWRRAVQRDAILGMSVGIFTMAFIVFAKQISAVAPSLAAALGPVARVAWPWYVLIGTAITLTVGVLSSFTHPAPEAAAEPAPVAALE